MPTERELLEGSFKNFLHRTVRSLGFGKPTKRMYEIADYLQHGGDRLEVLGFRGIAKSFTTVPYGLWILYRDPDEKVLAVSATARFAGDLSTFAFQMVESFDWLSTLKPRSDQRQSSLAFDVGGARPDKTPSFVSESIFGQITGKRASVSILDDVETPNTADTEPKRAMIEKNVGEIAAAVTILGQKKVVMLGTPHAEETLYLKQEAKGYSLRIWPFVFPTVEDSIGEDGKVIPAEVKRYGHRLAPTILQEVMANPELAGTVTDTDRFDDADIPSKRLEYGTVEFDRQFRLFIDAGGDQSKKMRLRDLIVCDFTPPALTGTSERRALMPASVVWSNAAEHKAEDIPVDAPNGDALYRASVCDSWGPLEGCLMWVDPSGNGSDESTWTVIGQRLGYVAALDQGYSLAGYDEDTMKAIAAMAKIWGVTDIKIESNFGQGMFGELLKPHLKTLDWPCLVEDHRSSGQKERRIMSNLSGLITNHRLLVNSELLRRDFPVTYAEISDAKRRYYRLTYQLTRLTTAKGSLTHDDRLDGLSSGVQQWIGALSRRTEEAAQADRDRLMDIEVEKFLDARKKQGFGAPEGRLGGLIGVGGILKSGWFRGRRG